MSDDENDDDNDYDCLEKAEIKIAAPPLALKEKGKSGVASRGIKGSRGVASDQALVKNRV